MPKLTDGSHRENLSRFDDRLRYISTALFGAGMLAVLLVANSGLVHNEAINRAPLNWVVAVAGVSVVGILLFPWHRYNRNLFVIASLVGLCLVALAIYFSGGWESPFFPFYFFLMVFCAIYFSPRVAALMVLLTVLVSLSPQLYAPEAAGLAEHIMVRMPTFLAVAIVSWYMAREVGRREHLRGEYEFALQEMREREARYRSIFDSNVLGLFFWEAEGRIPRANDAFLDMLGYTREDLQGEGLSWRELTPEEYRILDQEKLAEVLNRRVCQPFEKEYFHKDGSRVPVLLAIALLEGYRDRGVCFVLDLTERKRAEEALKESEQRFRLTVQSVEDYAIFSLDPEGCIASWNEGAERINGYKADEIIGVHFSIFYTEDDLERGHPEEELHIAAAEGRYEEEGLRVRKDGSRFWASVVITAMRDEEGNLRGFSKVTRDMTERKRYEAELNERAEELERSNRELEQFAYVASHDLQEPLRMVSSYTQLLARRYEGQLDETADEFIHYAVDGANRMQRLISDLLTYSRVGTRSKELVPTDCGVVFEAACANLRVAIEESGADVTSEELPTVMGDETQLVQLFQNLIGNALKFRGEKPPEVYVGAECRDGEWLFSVRDNGIGIEPQDRERIFVIFQRLHGKTDYPGTGIGLAVCKKIVERHGGRIWVESEPGEGSSFYFTLPARAEN